MNKMTEGDARIIVGMADLKTGKAPNELITNLGSCIGVCLYSSRNKVGGLLHLMLGHAGESATRENFKPAKYADTGIPELLRQLKINYSTKENDLVAKIFGGGKILKNVTNDIGLENENVVRKILYDLDIPIKAAQTGGEKGCRINFNLETGIVYCQVFGEPIQEH